MMRKISLLLFSIFPTEENLRYKKEKRKILFTLCIFLDLVFHTTFQLLVVKNYFVPSAIKSGKGSYDFLECEIVGNFLIDRNFNFNLRKTQRNGHFGQRFLCGNCCQGLERKKKILIFMFFLENS